MNLQDAQTAVATKLPGRSTCIQFEAWSHNDGAPFKTYRVIIWDGKTHHAGRDLDSAVQALISHYDENTPTLAAKLAADMEALAQPEAGQ